MKESLEFLLELTSRLQLSTSLAHECCLQLPLKLQSLCTLTNKNKRFLVVYFYIFLRENNFVITIAHITSHTDLDYQKIWKLLRQHKSTWASCPILASDLFFRYSQSFELEKMERNKVRELCKKVENYRCGESPMTILGFCFFKVISSRDALTRLGERKVQQKCAATLNISPTGIYRLRKQLKHALK